MAGTSALLVAAGILTALSLTQTIPFQCLYGAGAIFVLDVALASVIFAKKKSVKKLSGPLPELPPEVMIEIFKYLDLKTLLTVSRVCHQWSAISNDCGLLKYILGPESKYTEENLTLQKLGRLLSAFKSKASPDFTYNSPLTTLFSPVDSIIGGTGDYAVKFSPSSLKILQGGQEIGDYKIKKVPRFKHNICMHGSKIYYISGETLVGWDFKTQMKCHQKLSTSYEGLAVTDTKLVLFDHYGFEIYSKKDGIFIKKWSLVEIGTSFDTTASIFAFKEKIYFIDFFDYYLFELDIETGKTRKLYDANSSFFATIPKKKINKFLLSNGVIFIQLLGQGSIFRYDIDKNKWLPKLVCPPKYDLHAAFSGWVFAKSGTNQIVWDFRGPIDDLIEPAGDQECIPPDIADNVDIF